MSWLVQQNILGPSCPHYAGEIWKRTFISKVRPTVHTNMKTELFENSTVCRSSNRWNLKTPAFRFRVDGKHFENRAFRKRWHHDNHVISLTEFSSAQPQIVAFWESVSTFLIFNLSSFLFCKYLCEGHWFFSYYCCVQPSINKEGREAQWPHG